MIVVCGSTTSKTTPHVKSAVHGECSAVIRINRDISSVDSATRSSQEQILVSTRRFDLAFDSKRYVRDSNVHITRSELSVRTCVRAQVSISGTFESGIIVREGYERVRRMRVV